MPFLSKLRDRFSRIKLRSGHSLDVMEQSGFGIKELSPGTTPTIDIVAIHGLDADREKSWTADNEKLWLRDFLPRAVPTARILSYGYDAYTKSSLSEQTLYSHAQDFLVQLGMSRRTDDTKKRPIIFIAHSLGGIILKSALIQANIAHEGHLLPCKWIHLSTYGIVFLGTPQQGRDIIPKLVSLCRRPNNILLRHLTAHSKLLQEQISDFNAITAHFHIKSFYETLTTTLPSHTSTIVPRSSAVLPGAVNIEPIGMHKDHTGMSKFESVNDDDFKAVLCAIQDMVKKAPVAVHVRWIKFNENIPNWPIYIPKLCPSPSFVGQEKYLIRLRKFFAPENCLNSLPAWKRFLLYELLSNDYTHRKVFWIDGTNTETLGNGFSSIADDPEAKSKGIEKSSEEVLRWLTAIQKRCLIIFDNVDGMDGVVKEYLQQMRQIYVLITSRNPGLASHVTESMHVVPMESDEALVLFQAAAKSDNEADATIQELSEKIVSRLGFLPLALDIAGAAISTGLYTRADLNATYCELGRWTDAEQLEVQVLKVREQLLGTEHPDTLTARANLAGTYHHLGRWTDAEQLEVQVLKAREQLLGTEHPDTLNARANLAGTYHHLDRWTDAEQLEVQVLKAREQLLGTEHPDTVSAKASLAATYNQLDRWTDAEQLEVQVLKAREQLLGTEHPDTVSSKASLAATYHQLDRWTDAEPLEVQVLKAREQLLGTEHPDTLSARVLKVREQLLGTEHPYTLSAMANLVATYY
ncbi:hypothetical protein BU17DRAFT_78873 [Hysterangium stoloniferum]|nr:hypothetical protein BU17DRAFT_78873 [Hysterangium stoloniferum]